jgi:hypothetical protein
MHLSFESLEIIDAQSLQVTLMDIHHNTSFRSILENDSISSAFKTHIRFCLGKGTGLWLIVKSSIRSFCLTHFIFTLTLCFHFNLIQPLTSFECGHGLNTFSTHLACCPFEGQEITIYDTIKDIMYALTRGNGHDVWKELWYAFCEEFHYKPIFT